MVNKILLGGLIVLFIGGMSFMANAGVKQDLTIEQTAMCATMAVGSEYTNEAARLADKVQPYYENNKKYFTDIVREIRRLVELDAQSNGAELKDEYRRNFHTLCMESNRST